MMGFLPLMVFLPTGFLLTGCRPSQAVTHLSSHESSFLVTYLPTFTYLLDGFHLPPTCAKNMYEELVEDGKLTLEGWRSLVDLSVIPRGVRTLTIAWCQRLTSLVGLPEGLQTLKLQKCINLTSPVGLPVSLPTLFIWRCDCLIYLVGLPEGLRSLTIQGCDGPKVLPLLPNLQELDLDYPSEVCGQSIQTLEAYQAVCCAYSRKKSAYA